ncbi:peptide-binding protein [Jannaschia seohaensis]|uniref:SH3 domain-containing protein n=1 Tax=Jannaschia seohaensis TaxID=475081 RepID=A0A2Y9A0I5_9RHOB|nr:peptide-binding protein [Jannaschia seohaensis]PWJ21773.1 hypothetical protein BCF38_101181 [Jannaschia seohaensis]SSA38051.1 hypothetical protein SAMN05421539_101181 [Jannaschia seohaensis]
MRSLLAAILILLAAPATATQDAWPALFDVAGVSADDVLNIRAAPTAASEIVGTVAPDAVDIEVIRPNEALTWGLVNTAEGTGWVSLAFLQRQPGQWTGAYPPVQQCFGTEPFWSIDIDDRAATFSTPDTSIQGQVIARMASANRRDRHGLRIALPEGRWIDGVISWETCSDFMSDREYGLTFDALGTDGVLSGCCSLGR